MLLLIVIVLVIGTVPTTACTCINSPFCAKFESASDVIRATVNRQVPSTASQQLTFELSISAVFKTQNNLAANTLIDVTTASNAGVCGATFQIGNEYLVLLNGLATSLCSGNSLWSDVSASERAYLRSPRACGSCATILCPVGSTCQVDDLGVASCASVCNLKCPKGQICHLRDVICIRAPCLPIPMCVNPCADKQCADYQTCQIYPPTGEPYCADSCHHFPCPSGQTCQLEQVLCVRAPCPPRAVCVDPCAKTTCGRSQVCQIYPPTGEAYCADTCDNFPCTDGQVCSLNPVTCIRAPCPPVAQCGCQTVCIDIYEPVCGSDGQTYGNECQLNLANCNLLLANASATPITVASQGECPTGCAAVECLVGYECVVDSTGNGYCSPSCDNFPSCDVGQLCQVSSPDTCLVTISPCPVVAHCVDCPDVCNDIYQPVCGTDGNTYANSCELLRHNCGISDGSTLVGVAHDGECCPELCPTLVVPVCGSDGNTYNNECELQRTNCGSSPAVVVAHQGAC